MSLFVQVRGQGPAVALVHGWGMNGDVWWGTWPDTSPPDLRLYAPDLAGYGRSTECECSHTLEAMTDAVARALPEPAVWIGWSLGGLVALSAAGRQPDKVLGLILVASSPRFTRAPGWTHALEPALIDVVARGVAHAPRVALGRFLTLQTRAGGRTDRRLAAWLRMCMLRHGLPAPAVLGAGLDILRSADLRRQAASASCPRLLILGAQDLLVPAAVGEEVQRLGDWSVAVVPGAAHVPFLSHAQQVRELVHGFVHELA